MKILQSILVLSLSIAVTAWGDAEPFSFGVVADCQFCDGDTSGVRNYRESPKKLEACVSELNTHPLTFTVHLGDFIDRDWESFDVVLPIWKQLKAPGYHVLGNHDYSVADDKKALVHEKLGLPARYYDFTYYGWRFVALDGNDISFHGHPSNSPAQKVAEDYYTDNKIESPRWNGALGKEQLDWLKGVLSNATDKGESVVLMAHFPVFPENAHNLWNAKDVLQLIDANPCVKAYINGHNHAGNYGLRNSVHFVTFKGMVDTLENSFATVKVMPEELNITGFGREENRKLTLRK